MKRRQFLLRAAAAGTTQIVTSGVGLRAMAADSPAKDVHETDAQHLLGYTLSQLRQLYHRDLFEDWLPFMERHVLDQEYGGFLCNTDFDGTHTDMEKEALFEGRGVWVYASLYTHFGKDARYLEVARRSVELLSKSQPKEDAFWCTTIHRDGSPSSPPGKVIPTDIGIAEGYAAYAHATGKQEFLDRAKQLLHKCVQIYDRPDYNPTVGSAYFGAAAPPFPGARIMGSSMIMLRTAAQILEMDSDPAVDQLARRCADAVVHHHFNPEFRLNNELLHHDYSRPIDVYAQLCNLGNTLEMTWMLLDEATRQHDESMFRECAGRFQRHAEVAWDRVYDGVFHGMLNVDENRLEMNKLLWAQEEVLIDTLYIYDRTSAAWAAEMFGKMYKYIRERYPLTAHGSPMWMYATGRKATFEEFSGLRKRIENYHHPRHLIHNLRRLDAMVTRSNKRSAH